MALMSTLRDKTHIVLYTLLGAFLLLIVFEWGMNFTGPKSKAAIAGKVNGEQISAARYEEMYKDVSDLYRRTDPQAELTPEKELELREEAWNRLVDQTLLEQQFKKFGIAVHDQEIVEAFNSTVNPPVVIRQNFTDPATGEIDHKRLESIRQDPAGKELLIRVEKMVRQELMVNKLLYALQTLVHVTDRELTGIVERQYARYRASFIPFPLSAAGADANFPVKDEEVKRYYDEHKALFRQQPTRKAEYVFFPLVPSGADSLGVRKELEAIRNEFAAAVNDSDFVKMQSDRPQGANTVLSRADFSPAASAAVFESANLKSGSIIGPIADRGVYHLLKIKGLSQAKEPLARASHILLPLNPADGNSIKKVQEQVATIYKKLQQGVPFGELARTYSVDKASAVQDGDLGWFTRERMVPEFAAAVFNARPGMVLKLLQTRFGVHIIYVTGFDNTALLCSDVVRTIQPSSDTVDSQRRLASTFQMEAKEKGFAERAAANKRTVEETGDFGRRTMIGALGLNDKIAAFAFNAKEGALSDVIETPKGFYVVHLTGKNDTGYRMLDASLQKMISSELVREKKSDALKKRLATLLRQPGTTLQKIVATEQGITVVQADSIRLSDGFIPGYGVDPILAEGISVQKQGVLAGPVQSSNGYAVVQLEQKTMPTGFDMKGQKEAIGSRLLQAKQDQVFAEYFNSLRQQAAIEDYRP